jgi:hypothetical protein
MEEVVQTDELEGLWQAIPTLLDQDDGLALREVLNAGGTGYTREDDTLEGWMIRHNPDGTRQLVRINLDSADTPIRIL